MEQFRRSGETPTRFALTGFSGKTHLLMQIIYLLPFAVLSGLSAAVCLIVPRWRPYAFAAVIAPVAFAACGIAGLMAILLTADVVGFAGALGLNQPWHGGARDYVAFTAAFAVPGIVGASVAVLITNRLQRWYLAHRL